MRAVVVAGGEPVDRDAVHLAAADLLIAADGGAKWLDALGHQADLLVGDLDSAPAALVATWEAAGAVIERHPVDKDATDAELAVTRAVAHGADEVILLGALGGLRLDHELANLLLLADPAYATPALDLRIVRNGTTVRAARSGMTLELTGAVGDLVSLLPVGDDAHGVSTVGLHYPLHDSDLGLGRSRGLSNVVVTKPTSVSVDQGTLLVVETELKTR